jgi:hypothetical protein
MWCFLVYNGGGRFPNAKKKRIPNANGGGRSSKCNMMTATAALSTFQRLQKNPAVLADNKAA